MQEGIFIPFSQAAQEKLFAILEREGYTPNPEGLGVFLHDVASGKMDANENPTNLVGTLGKVLRENGPSLAQGLATILRGRAK